MDFYETVAARRTIRNFEDRAIPENVLERIIRAGLQAPTNNHMREWEFIILNDKTKRLEAIRYVPKDLSVEESTAIIDKWGLTDECQREMYLIGIPRQYQMLLNAGCLIIPAFRHHGILLKPESMSALNSFASIWCCIENMLLAAAAEGIFGVTRIPFEEETHHLKATLGIPDGYELPCYLALGYPAKELPPSRQIPIKTKDRIHLGHW
ncbi:MAG: nitroreductase family protein [Lacrimispora sp.]